MKRVLVLGGSGLLGQDVVKVFGGKYEVISPPHIGLDVEDGERVSGYLRKWKFDVCINCTGFNDVDGCEDVEGLGKARILNIYVPINLAMICRDVGTEFMQVSSDYVFGGGGERVRGYEEWEGEGPVNMYGRTKMQGELCVKKEVGKQWIVRTGGLFGSGRRTFLDKAVQDVKDGKEVKCVVDMEGSYTWTEDLAKKMMEVMERGVYGVYHLVNGGFYSRYEVVMLACEHLGLDTKFVKAVKQSELGLKAKRPVFSGLKQGSLERVGLEPMREWYDAMRDYLLIKSYG